jgi:hypothetical protein
MPIMNKRLEVKHLNMALMAAALVAMATIPAAAEGPFDGTKNMVCAVNRAYECSPREGCDEVDPEVVEVSSFFLVNFRKKEISAIFPADDDVSPIEHVESANGGTIIQGSESGRGWGIVVDQTTGRFSASIYGKLVGFLLYGVCMPK